MSKLSQISSTDLSDKSVVFFFKEDPLIQFTALKEIGKGSFGIVYQTSFIENGDIVAIKKIALTNPVVNHREVHIMQNLEHQNIIKLKQFFHMSQEHVEPVEQTPRIYLYLVLEYLPTTLTNVVLHYKKSKQTVPPLYIKLFTYQLFRALAYIHSLGICHRDIKPQNLLIDPESAILKLCDFGSAKELKATEPSVSYVCSRYYRAPELIFESRHYTCQVDTWSGGCVVAGLLLGAPLFPGASSVDQAVAVIKVLGTPTKEQIQAMNPTYAHTSFPQIAAHPWSRVFRPGTDPRAVELVSRLLQYNPTDRLTPKCACADGYFDELRDPLTKLPGGRELPPLFNFSPQELGVIEDNCKEDGMKLNTNEDDVRFAELSSSRIGLESDSVSIPSPSKDEASTSK